MRMQPTRLRAAVSAKTPVGLKAKAAMDAGALVTDEIVFGIIEVITCLVVITRHVLCRAFDTLLDAHWRVLTRAIPSRDV